MSSLEVIHGKTFDTDLVPWRRSASCVMNNGDIALWGKTSKKAPREFHIYNKDAQKVKKIKRLCQHKNVHMLSIVIENVEYLAVSCMECGDINLQHLTIDTAYPAFSSDNCSLMCNGKEGEIFLKRYTDEKKTSIIEIGCKRKQFVYGKTFESKIKSVHDICYVSTKGILVMSRHKKGSKYDEFSDEDTDKEPEEKEKDEKKEDPAFIQAIQYSSGKELWEVKEVDDLETCAHAVIYSHKYDVLLVADGSNRRILVLQPDSGEHLQTIDFRSQHVGTAWNLFLHRDQLILEHALPKRIQLSYYTVSLMPLNLINAFDLNIFGLLY